MNPLGAYSLKEGKDFPKERLSKTIPLDAIKTNSPNKWRFTQNQRAVLFLGSVYANEPLLTRYKSLFLGNMFCRWVLISPSCDPTRYKRLKHGTPGSALAKNTCPYQHDNLF